MKPITSIKSKTVSLQIADIDTDQIIPARFLTTTSREGPVRLSLLPSLLVFFILRFLPCSIFLSASP